MGQTQSCPSSPLAAREHKLSSSLRENALVDAKAFKKRRSKSSSLNFPSSSQRGSWPPRRADSLAPRYGDEQTSRARLAAEEKLSGRGQRGDTPSSFGSIAKSPIWGKNENESSPELDGLGVRVGGQKLSRMRVKRTASGKPDLLASPPTPINVPSLFVTVQDIGNESTYQPIVAEPSDNGREHPATLSVPVQQHQNATNSPKSHWSESSVGCPTPPEPLHSFRDSLNLALNSKRFSSGSTNRLSAIINAGQDSEESSIWRNPSRDLSASRRKHKNSKKRGPIVVVGAERMGSGRYSMMKAAAAQSASNRKANLHGVRGVEEDIATAANVQSSSRPVVTSQIPLISPTRNPTDEQACTSSPKRQSSAEELLTFIAASPDLTCADPNAPLFETQAAPKKSISRLPEGHPGNHHSRFRRLKQMQASEMLSDANQPKSDEHELTTLRRDSSQSRRSSISSTAVRRKLSNIRLSICGADTENDGEADVPEARRGSSASWATSRSRTNSAELTATPRRKTSTGSLRHSSTLPIAHGRGSVGSVTMPFIGPTAPLRPRPVSTTSRMSFPQSVTGTSDAAETPKRELRRSSNATSYFGKQDLPTTPDSLPSPPPLPMLPAAGEINWASYSLTSLVCPVTSPGASTESRSSYIAPETVDAFPMPPANRLQAIAPAPLILVRDEDRPSSRPASFPSDASTPSSAASSVDTATSLSLSEGLLQRQQHDTASVYNLMPFMNTLERDSKSGLGEPASPALSCGGRSSADATVCNGLGHQHPSTGFVGASTEPSATATSPVSTTRRPSTARLESPVIHLWPAEPLPRASANIRESRVLQFADFKLDFATPKLSTSRQGQVHVAQDLLDCVSPTQDVLDALNFEDDEELEAARHRFPSNDLIALPSPSVDLTGHEDDMKMVLVSLETEQDVQGGVPCAMYDYNSRRHHSTTALPSPPPLVNVPTTALRRDTHPIWVPPSLRKDEQNGFDIGDGLRLDTSDKRGFDRMDVTDWLERLHNSKV
ncbi:hypothetical protein OIV83_001248 [Microbotryomycetes sp. JL201]|nr:hypothetical protein OIV83_001248 [Microbotryomycetes sp. JL201]